MATVFGYTINISGALVKVLREPLHPACLSDDEVNHHIGYLKEELDRVADEMKQAILKQQNEPIFGNDDA